MDITDIIIIEGDDLACALAENYIKGLSFPCRAVKMSLKDALQLKDTKNPSIVLVNMEDVSIAQTLAGEYAKNKNINIAAMSYDGSADMQVKAFRLGAADFLLKPLVKTDFINTLQEISRAKIYKENDAQQAKVYTAVSDRQGLGKSGFLINLAHELAGVSMQKVLLLDFDTAGSRIAFLLNSDAAGSSAHNTGYYINNLTLDNAQALLADIPRYKDSSLYIMADTSSKNNRETVKKDKIEPAVNILKQYFKYILIHKTPDAPGTEDETIINLAGEVFCLAVPYVSSAAKLKKILEKYCKNKKIRLILNQYTAEDELKIEQIQSILGMGIFWKIPKNYTASNTAVNKNITLKEAAGETDISEAYLDIAKYLASRD